MSVSEVITVVTEKTASNQGWMALFKFVAVLAICGAQVKLTTNYFNQKPKRGGKVEMNPFAQSVI